MTRPALLSVVIASALVGALCASGLLLVFGADGGGTTTILSPVSEPAGTTGGPALSSGVPVLGNGFDPAAIYAARSSGVVTIYADLGDDGGSQGSGFVVDRQGRILTNAHVITNVAESPERVRGARRVYVEFKDGERVPATIVGWDLFNDTGVLEVDPADHPVNPVPFGDSDAIRVGTPVAAIGSPFGKQSSLAVGVVSAIGRTIDSLTSGFAIADAIQIDAPINRGNSGGPLFDPRGRVIGLSAQIQSTSGVAEGVGFVIPINSAARSLRQLLRTGSVAYAYLGIETQNLTPGVAEALGLPVRRGAIIAGVKDGTPAAKAGLRAGAGTRSVNGVDVPVGGDVLVAIAGRQVWSSDDVGRIVAEALLPGQTVALVVVRDRRRVEVLITLGERPRER